MESVSKTDSNRQIQIIAKGASLGGLAFLHFLILAEHRFEFHVPTH